MSRNLLKSLSITINRVAYFSPFLACARDSQVDSDVARCELERLLTTAGTKEKRKKIMLALARLEVVQYMYRIPACLCRRVLRCTVIIDREHVERRLEWLKRLRGLYLSSVCYWRYRTNFISTTMSISTVTVIYSFGTALVLGVDAYITPGEQWTSDSAALSILLVGAARYPHTHCCCCCCCTCTPATSLVPSPLLCSRYSNCLSFSFVLRRILFCAPFPSTTSPSEQGSCGGSTSATIVNEARPTASRIVAGPAKRRYSFSGHETARNKLNLDGGFDRGSVEAWRTSEEKGGLKSTAAANPSGMSPTLEELGSPTGIGC